MRLLRVLLNSIVAGGVAACYLAVLFLQLNPGVPIEPSTIGRLLAALLPLYGTYVAAAICVALVLRQVLGADRMPPAWISVRVLPWVLAIVVASAAALMWLNLRALRPSLDPFAARRMAEGAGIVTLCAALLLLLALVRASLGRRTARHGAAALLVIVVFSLVWPVMRRSPGPLRSGSGGPATAGPSFEPASSDARVVMLLIDGASLDYISPAAADGRLPNFGRVLDTGAVMHLATLRPTQPGPVWAAVATGKLPYKNGVRSAAWHPLGLGRTGLDLLPDYCFAHALVYFGLLSEQAQTSASFRASPLWTLVGESGIESVIVRWPLTYPARPAHGAMVTDRLHLASGPMLTAGEPAVTYPHDLAAAIKTRPEPSTAFLQALTAPATAAAGSLVSDRLYSAAFEAVSASRAARLLAIRYQSVDVAGHYYLRQAMPRVFGDVSEQERRRFGRVLDQYYRYIDTEVGRAIDRLGPDDLLLVVSGFGMEPLSLPKRLIERTLGSGELSGTHERAPDGFVLAWGAGVQPGRLARASVVDVAPTVLYFFGLPIGRDMDGFARTDIFTKAFTAERPVTFIPSYDGH